MTTCYAAAHSNDPTTFVALDQVLTTIKHELGGPANLAVIFVTGNHAAALERIAPVICEQLETKNVIGCTAETVIANGTECEEQSTLAIWAGRLSSGSVTPVCFEFTKTNDGPTILGLPELSELQATGTLLMLGEPFSFPADYLLEQVHESAPRLAILGGMASAAHEPGQNRLVCGTRVLKTGAVGLLLDAEVPVRSVVSQGCRPIGKTWIITKAERNVILELGGQPALKQLQATFGELSAEDRELVHRGVHVGRVMSEYRDQFGPGDFLIRNVVGADPESGAIAIGDFVRVGQTVQFQIRDATTADQELTNLLATAQQQGNAAGALLFTCNGRGTRLFGEPHHDANCVQQQLGTIPVAGLFAAGEIGPVSGVNYLHGFTASVAIFGE